MWGNGERGLGKKSLLWLKRGGNAGEKELIPADNGPPERAGLQSVIDSERQPPCADLSGAGDGERGGADNEPPERPGLQSVIDSERQPPGADLSGAGDGKHGGADNRPPERVDCSQ